METDELARVTLFDTIRATGLTGTVVMVMGLALLVWAVLLLALGGERRAYVRYTITAFVPLAIAVIGACLRDVEVACIVGAAGGAVTPADLANFATPKHMLLAMGLTASLPFVFFGAYGINRAGGDAAGPSRSAGADE